ncbi:MAG: NAD-binding oxidoreductase, partial [Pseudomonadota bacterium]
MTIRFLSDARRPVHLGGFPLEKLPRGAMPDLAAVPPAAPLDFRRPETPASIVNAMTEYQAMMDAIRDGLVNKARAEIPADPAERANHLKAFGYFSDAAMAGIGPLPPEARLTTPWRNPDIDALAEALRTRQTKTLASGIDLIMADLKDAMEAPPSGIASHRRAIVYLYDMPRDPAPDEPGCAWLENAQAHRAALRAAETAVVIANYIRLLGWDAKAHTATSSDIDLNVATVAAGLALPHEDALQAPFLGPRFGVAVVTTDMELAEDAPLAPEALRK